MSQQFHVALAAPLATRSAFKYIFHLIMSNTKSISLMCDSIFFSLVLEVASLLVVTLLTSVEDESSLLIRLIRC